MPFAGVSPDWIHELSEIAAMTLADFRRHVGDQAFAMLAVDCRPADGFISLSMLLSAESAIDPSLADPARTSAWKHEGLERKTGMWRLAAGVERVMQETYHCAEEADRPAIAEAFVGACLKAIHTERVAAEVECFLLAESFRITS
ncbi:hypothetical protein [Humisphaera borealis]|nr:hypothetical protein [Humisphaera borealis]